MVRSRPTKRKDPPLAAEQVALVEAEQAEPTEDDDWTLPGEIARPAKLAKDILVCCKAGIAKKTKFALAKCPDCENCSHGECAKDYLSLEQRALLKRKAGPPGHNKTILLEGWQCAGCSWKEEKVKARLNLNKQAAKLTKKQASRKWECPEGCGAGGIGGTGQRKLHLQCYCKELDLPWPQACHACGKLMGDPHVLKRHLLRSCKKAGGDMRMATVVTVIGEGATVNVGTPVLATTVDPQQGQSQD